MKAINLFGVYCKQKRQEKNLPLREIASKTGVSHTYLYNIEKGLKAPPNDLLLIKLADILSLDQTEKNLWFDIAAKDQQQRNNSNFYIPVDVMKYLSDTALANDFIRKVNELGYSDEFWIELLKEL